MALPKQLENLVLTAPLLKDATASGNLAVLRSMLGPAWRGLVQQQAKNAPNTSMPLSHRAHFDWTYARNQPEMSRLYEAAKASQWNATTDLDWSIDVDPMNPETELIPDALLPVVTLPS
ncbi:MAG: hypothetical protein ACJ790_13630, partial [Myxococcaceae bacterium]